MWSRAPLPGRPTSRGRAPSCWSWQPARPSNSSSGGSRRRAPSAATARQRRRGRTWWRPARTTDPARWSAAPPGATLCSASRQAVVFDQNLRRTLKDVLLLILLMRRLCVQVPQPEPGAHPSPIPCLPLPPRPAAHPAAARGQSQRRHPAPHLPGRALQLHGNRPVCSQQMGMLGSGVVAASHQAWPALGQRPPAPFRPAPWLARQSACACFHAASQGAAPRGAHGRAAARGGWQLLPQL